MVNYCLISLALTLWVVIELNVPVFSEDGKVEMAGSGSEHEFPRCDGHGGADFADTKDVKKPTGEVGFFTVPLQSWLLWTGKDSLYLT
ncbi:hypothetical protein ACFDZZ_004140 [Salmonella enterica]